MAGCPVIEILISCVLLFLAPLLLCLVRICGNLGLLPRLILVVFQALVARRKSCFLSCGCKLVFRYRALVAVVCQSCDFLLLMRINQRQLAHIALL